MPGNSHKTGEGRSDLKMRNPWRHLGVGEGQFRGRISGRAEEN